MIVKFSSCLNFLLVKCLKCNMISSGYSHWIAVYLMHCSMIIHTCTHTNQFSFVLFSSIREIPVASFKKQHRGCTRAYRHLLRANSLNTIHQFCYQRRFTLQILHLQITEPQLYLILSCCHNWLAMRTDLEL